MESFIRLITSISDINNKREGRIFHEKKVGKYEYLNSKASSITATGLKFIGPDNKTWNNLNDE